MDESKKDKICRRDTDGTLIYQPPHKDTLYTIDELEELLSGLKGVKIPENNRSSVRKSHWVKREALELLGYDRPNKIRGETAEKHTPKFIHQVMSIFVQSQGGNLNVWADILQPDVKIEADWRYEREFDYSDARVVIVRHGSDDYVIRGVRVVEGEEVASWDNTGTKTFKWQGTIPKSFRQKTTIKIGDSDPIFNTLDITRENLDPLDHRINRISEKDSEITDLLASKPPHPELLLTIEEIGNKTSCLVGDRIPDVDERRRGQLFEKIVAKEMGYQFSEDDLSGDKGDFPDIRHQFLDTKLQSSGTVDFGKYHPDDGNALDAGWTQSLAPRDGRYLLGLADKVDGEYEINGIIVLSGDEFGDYFSVTEEENSKEQMPIPNFESIGDDDVEVQSEPDDQTHLDDF